MLPIRFAVILQSYVSSMCLTHLIIQTKDCTGTGFEEQMKILITITFQLGL